MTNSYVEPTVMHVNKKKREAIGIPTKVIIFLKDRHPYCNST